LSCPPLFSFACSFSFAAPTVVSVANCQFSSFRWRLAFMFLIRRMRFIAARAFFALRRDARFLAALFDSPPRFMSAFVIMYIPLPLCE
jgi:hypothetical protein